MPSFDRPGIGRSTKTASGDHLGHFNFKIEIDGVVQAGFQEVSGLESETEVIEYKDGDDITVRKRPGRTKYSNLTFKRGFANTPEFWEWRRAVINGMTARKSGSVIVMNDAGEETMRYNFFEAWPCKWTGPALNANQGQHAIEQIELAVERWEKK